MAEEILAKLTQHIQTKLVGNQEAIQLLLVAALTGGHVLLEDDPGTGKTALSRAFSESLKLDFKRIQCTPDLLPSDLTGLNIYQPNTQTFKFIAGPVFTELLLADELNRATPRTQAALLEAMAEKQVSIDGTTRELSSFFMVIATQNPLETAGTFPLPEAQLDRFLLQFSLTKMSLAEKEQMIDLTLGLAKETALHALYTKEDLTKMRAAASQVTLHPDLKNYLVRLCSQVTQLEGVVAQISNRGLLDYVRACQSLAYLKGRDHIVPEDIQYLAVPLLAHRLFFRNPLTTTKQKEEAIHTLLQQVAVPTEIWKEG